jgi:hypothetical protein
MESGIISKEIKIRGSKMSIFIIFLEEIFYWWPGEYTWSGDKLVNLTIANEINGLCTETGPYNFRCDWGRITELIKGERIGMKWQIGINRQPVPDPDMASDLLIEFKDAGNVTFLSLKHYNFQHHGEGFEEIPGNDGGRAGLGIYSE